MPLHYPATWLSLLAGYIRVRVLPIVVRTQCIYCTVSALAVPSLQTVQAVPLGLWESLTEVERMAPAIQVLTEVERMALEILWASRKTSRFRTFRRPPQTIRNALPLALSFSNHPIVFRLCWLMRR